MGGSINDADYVILGNTLSKTFPDLLAQTTAVNKLPLRSAFIVDCVKHAALLDVDNYVLEEYTPPKKRGRPSVGTMKAEKPKEKKEPRKMTPKKKAIQPVGQIRYDGPPSPTPPPLSTRIELPGGYFRFSDEEVNFFKRYARHLVETDHQISNTAIFKRMHEKVSLSTVPALHQLSSHMSYMLRCHITLLHLGELTSGGFAQMSWISYAKRLALHDAKPLMPEATLKPMDWARFKMKLVHRKGAHLPSMTVCQGLRPKIHISKIFKIYANSLQQAEAKIVMTM
jgi:hypothetical protein